MKTRHLICLLAVTAILAGCKTAQRTPPPMPPTSAPPTSSSPPSSPSSPSQESSRQSSPSQDSSSRPSSPSPTQSPSAQPSSPSQETAQSSPPASGAPSQPAASEPDSGEKQAEAAENLKKAGQQVAEAGAQLPDGTSGSEQPSPQATPTSGDEEWDPLMLPDEAASNSQQADQVADSGASSAEPAAEPDSGETGAASDTAQASPAGESGETDPLMEEIQTASQAAQRALEEAGIALETAGGALETATTSEELAAAEAALARARVSVIVAGQDLMDLKELIGDPGLQGVVDQAEEALNEANGAIVIATDSIFSTRISLPEYEQEQIGAAGRGNGESELDKALNESIVVFENQILEARNEAIGSAPPPTSAENIPGVAVLGGTLEDKGEEGTFDENQDSMIIGEESEITQQGHMPEGAELAEAKDVVPSMIPDDIPDPQGDDIVAQQLREAAIAETDPSLREKLWEEYRRYKAGL